MGIPRARWQVHHSGSSQDRNKHEQLKTCIRRSFRGVRGRRGVRDSALQSPHLDRVQRPGSFWFPAARGFSWTYRPTSRPDNDAYQGKLYGKALGEVPAQQTHELERAPGVEDTLTPAIYETPEKLRTVDFTEITTFDHISLRPTLKVDPQSPDRSPYSPILVVKFGDEIVDGHNGLFGSEGSDFRRFLTKYIAYVEGKRLVLRAGNQLNLQNSNPIAASAASAASVTDALGPKRPRADSKVSIATAAILRTAEPAPRCRDPQKPSE